MQRASDGVERSRNHPRQKIIVGFVPQPFPAVPGDLLKHGWQTIRVNPAERTIDD